MKKEEKNNIFNIDGIMNLLTSNQIGLWTIELNNNTGINKMYCNDIVVSLMGIMDENITPETIFEYWYTRIHKGYHSYVQKALEKVCLGQVSSVEIQYTWNHPLKGSVSIRSCGSLEWAKNGVFFITGYHQNISGLSQMKLIMDKADKEIFEWHSDEKTAYIHTKCRLLDTDETTFENFPEILIEKGIVHSLFKNKLLETFENIKKTKENVICELKLKSRGGKYDWYKIILSKNIDEKDEASLIIGSIENISQLKEMEIAYIKEAKFYHSILKEVTAYTEVNLSKNELLRSGGDWSMYYKYTEKMSYSQIAIEHCLKNIYKEDIETCANIINRNTLLEKYNSGETTIKTEFRKIISEDDIVWMEMVINLFEEPYTKNILALIYLKNINDNKIQKALMEQTSYNTDYIIEDDTKENLENYDFNETKKKSLENLAKDEEFVYLINPETYEIIDGNDAFYELINMKKEDCKGIKCFEAIHRRNNPCSLCKKLLWNSDEFFIWTQKNLVFNQDFLIKNKLVKYKEEKAMLTFATILPEKHELNVEDNFNTMEDFINNIYVNNENDIVNYFLETISKFYNSEYGAIIQKDKNDETYELKYFYTKDKTKERVITRFQQEYDKIIFNNKINSPIYIENIEDAIAYSYELYKFMNKKRILNLVIIPLRIDEENYNYVVCTNIFKEKVDLQYGAIIGHFILEEIVKRKYEADLEYSYYHDKLTGLNNRYSFRKYELEYDKDSIKSIGAFCFSINELSNVNHSVGIEAGDQILKDTSKLLLEVFKTKCFRFNGNEFLAIIENTEYTDFIEKIKEFEEKAANLGVSITYGKLWSDSENELSYIVNNVINLRKTEHEKYKNGNNLKVNSKKSTLLSELMIALESNEFEIFLQPKIHIKTNKIAGAEALIRRKNQEGGYISPDKFIPLFENNYLIQYIDLFVFEGVYKLLEKWKSEGKEIFPISLNFSKRTLLDPFIMQSIKNIKKKYTIEEKYIEIEVTESIGDIEKQQIFYVIKDIEKLGYKILLDDFGVKYSNLSILSEIYFDGIKLDKSMVKNIGFNITNDIIIKNIITMCKDMRILSIAEGIETKEQEDVLKNMNCEIGQGYLYSKPICIDEFIKKYF